MNGNTRTAWTVAGGLGIAVVVLLLLLVAKWNQPSTLTDITGQGVGDISVQRQAIHDNCPGTDDASRSKCAEALKNTSQIIQELTQDIASAQGTTSASTSASAGY